VIAVEVDTRRHQSRWYPGAGIYRKVTMTVTGAVHLGHWGTFVSTPAVSDGRATVRVQNSVENHLAAAQNLTVEVALLDPSGKQVVTGAKKGAAPANGRRVFSDACGAAGSTSVASTAGPAASREGPSPGRRDRPSRPTGSWARSPGRERLEFA